MNGPRRHSRGGGGSDLDQDQRRDRDSPRAPNPSTRREKRRSRTGLIRRDFHDVWRGTGSPIAREALERIGALYDIERQITGTSAERRLEIRQKESRPRVEDFRAWMTDQLRRIPGKGDLAKAMRYALTRWESFTLFPTTAAWPSTTAPPNGQ